MKSYPVSAAISQVFAPALLFVHSGLPQSIFIDILALQELSQLITTKCQFQSLIVVVPNRIFPVAVVETCKFIFQPFTYGSNGCDVLIDSLLTTH